jgi:hypothetical protein
MAPIDRYMIQHGLGAKWSIYFSTLVDSILSEIGYKIADQLYDHNSLSFKIAKM